MKLFQEHDNNLGFSAECPRMPNLPFKLVVNTTVTLVQHLMQLKRTKLLRV